MVRIIRIFIVTLFIVSFVSCSKENFEEETWYVADHMISCMGVFPQSCYLIKRQGSDPWQAFYSQIEKFDYQPGYEYRIRVVMIPIENPPLDAPGMRYVLKRLISKD